MNEEKNCSTCGYFGDAIFCCFHPDNEGRRAFPNTKACNKHRNFAENPLTESEKNDFFKNLFG